LAAHEAFDAAAARPMPPGSQGRVDPRRAMSPVMGQMAPPDLGRQGPIGPSCADLIVAGDSVIRRVGEVICRSVF